MIGQCGIRIAANHAERAVPARAGEKVLTQIDEVTHHGTDRCASEVLCRSSVRPIDEQRFADNVVARNKTPVAAVKRIIAVVAHRKIMTGRYNNFAVLDVTLIHIALQLTRQTVLEGRRLRGEVIALSQ